MLEKLQLLLIWNRLKRLLRGLILKIGMGKAIDWAKTFAEFMGIMESVADVQDGMEKSGQVPGDTPDSDPPASILDSATKTQQSITTSPYDTLVPRQRGQQLKDAIAKNEEKKRRRLFGRKSQQ